MLNSGDRFIAVTLPAGNFFSNGVHSFGLIGMTAGAGTTRVKPQADMSVRQILPYPDLFSRWRYRNGAAPGYLIDSGR